MQKRKKFGAQILSMVLTAAMVTTMLPTTVFATEGASPSGISDVVPSAVATVQSFDKLADRFTPSVGEAAPDYVYGLSVQLGTPEEELLLPDELGATVERATPDATVSSEAVAVTWHSDKEYQPDVNGTFIYTAELTEDYILADGVELPQIYVAVGKQARAATAEIVVGGTSATGGYETANATTLQKAFKSIAPNGTVTIGDGIDLGKTCIIISGDKAVTLNLNGQSISFAGGEPGVFGAIRLTDTASLTVDDSSPAGDGSIICGLSYGFGIENSGTGEVTILGGTVRSTEVFAFTIFNSNAGKVTVSGGTVEATKHYAIKNSDTGEVTVTGGTVSATEESAIHNSGSVTVTGGTVSATEDRGQAIYNRETGKVTVSGGIVKATGARGTAILNNGAGKIVVTDGTVSVAGDAIAIDNTKTGEILVSGGTVSAMVNQGFAIYNRETGSVTVSGGTVEAKNLSAIRNIKEGKITISQEAGKTTVVTSACANIESGTIHLEKVSTPAKVILDIQGGTVSNPITTGYAVYFKPSTVTGNNLFTYYTQAADAHVGKVKPPPASAITVTINGTEYGGATLQEAIGKLSGGAAAVTSLKITAGKVTTADWNYLTNLTALTTFEIAGTVTNVADIPTASPSTFPTSIVSVTVPQAISIGSNAFSGCNKLTTATFPAATDISVVAFSGCSELTDVSFPAVETIENAAFSGCSKLETASFLVATEIGAAAFRDCSMLASASFPKVESLGNFSFKGCTALVTLKLGATAPTSVETDAFDGCPTTRALGYVGADGIDLADDALTAAQAAYTADANDGSTTDGKWYGWTIVSAPITVTINGTPHEGATLQEAITASGITDAGVNTLKITAGKVTTADWEYLENLTALTTFEIARTVTNVADIPDGTSSIPTFPKSIVTVTVPQAITIGENVFNDCAALTTASFPEATAIGNNAFRRCNYLTTVSLPKAISIGNEAFTSCNRLMSISFPAATSIGSNAFFACTALVTLKLPATPPSVGSGAFANCPTTRALGYVGADGIDLADAALTAAQAAYKAVATDGSTSDNLWYGWAIVPTTGGDDDSGSSSGSSGGAVNGITTSGKTVIDNPVGNQGTLALLSDAANKAATTGVTNPTVYANFANYTALTKDGLKAINDAAAAAVKGKKVQLNTRIQLDNKSGNAVLSRITVAPAKLSAVMPNSLYLGVWFDQKQDSQVTAVRTKFEKAFTNKMVIVTFEQRTPLKVDMEFAAKPDMSGLNKATLYFYSYNPDTNLYYRIWNPGYWVDTKGYTHFTAPFGGSVLITDRPLTKK